jgi:hypothetical protein
MHQFRFETLSILLLAATLIFCGCVQREMTGVVQAPQVVQGSEKHYECELRNFKRKLFLGIFPTTKQAQWSYHFDLVGEGPTYSLDQLRVDDSFALTNVSLKVVSGHLTIDHSGHTVAIDIRVEQAGITNQFIGNGTYSFQE